MRPTALATAGGPSRHLAPDHSLMIGRHDFAAALDQRSIGVEQQL
jgi:hypothetical protein